LLEKNSFKKIKAILFLDKNKKLKDYYFGMERVSKYKITAIFYNYLSTHTLSNRANVISKN